MTNDLIDRQALLERLKDVENSMIWDAQSCELLFAFRRFINKAPAVDAVEVVRCGTPCRWLHNEPDYYCCTKHKGLVRITPDSFCSYGERREENVD